MRLLVNYHDIRRCCDASGSRFLQMHSQELDYANSNAAPQEDEQRQISKGQKESEDDHNKAHTSTKVFVIDPDSKGRMPKSNLPLPPTELHDGRLFRKVG